MIPEKITIKALLSLVLSAVFSGIFKVLVSWFGGRVFENFFLNYTAVNESNLSVGSAVGIVAQNLGDNLFASTALVAACSILILWLMFKKTPNGPDTARKNTNFFKTLFFILLCLPVGVFSILIGLDDYFSLQGKITAILLAIFFLSLPYYLSTQFFAPVSYRPLFRWPLQK